MIRVIKRENVNKENVKLISKFSCKNHNEVELMQNFDCDTTRIQAYNLTNCPDYYSDYGIVMYDKRTKISSYAYFNNVNDLFTYYDVLFRYLNR